MPRSAHPTDDRRVVRVYLGDHMAVMHGGSALAARMRDSPYHDAQGALLREVADELTSGTETIGAFLRQLGASPPRAKMLAVSALELVGRRKLNGRVASRSPLSRLLELEALRGVVGTGGAFWEAVDRAGFAAREPVRAHADRCAELGGRVEQARLDVAAEVLAPGAEDAPS